MKAPLEVNNQPQGTPRWENSQHCYSHPLWHRRSWMRIPHSLKELRPAGPAWTLPRTRVCLQQQILCDCFYIAHLLWRYLIRQKTKGSSVQQERLHSSFQGFSWIWPQTDLYNPKKGIALCFCHTSLTQIQAVLSDFLRETLNVQTK